MNMALPRVDGFLEPGERYVFNFSGQEIDLQDLLLLDPIHDIEQEGWPVANPKDEN